MNSQPEIPLFTDPFLLGSHAASLCEVGHASPRVALTLQSTVVRRVDLDFTWIPTLIFVLLFIVVLNQW